MIIKIDVSDEFTSNLTVFDIKCNGKRSLFELDDFVYGEIIGDIGKVERLERNLIHEIRRNV